MPQPAEQLIPFIISHKRPDRVFTYETLRRCGYTGPIYIILDNLDPTRQAYLDKFGSDQVRIFDKAAVAAQSDLADNFRDWRTTTLVRNATFQTARELGIKYFIQLDDDYTMFRYRFDSRLDYVSRTPIIQCMDKVLQALLEFYIESGATTLAFFQGGDFIGGAAGTYAEKVMVRRKAMNSFICSTERQFQFRGRLNEDVNTYVLLGSRGQLFLSTNQVDLGQMQTQGQAGGMTEAYLDSGTYVKSFYSVIHQPSSVKVGMLPSSNARLHHQIAWRYTVPKLMRQSTRKAGSLPTLPG